VIHKLYIDFENNGHIERLVLPGAQAPTTTTTVAENTPSTGDDIEDMAKGGIKKIDDNNYEIDRNLIAKVLENPMGLAKYARIVPSMKDGKPDGFKMYGIRPNSPVALLGLQNGDTLDAVNGFAMTSANSALDAYMKLRDATTLSLDVTRKGKQMNMKYVIK